MSTATGRHELPAKRKGLKRKFLGVPVALWLVLAVGGTALAVIALLLRGGFSGTVTEGHWDLVLTGNSAEVFTEGNCTAVRDAETPSGTNGEVAGDIAITWSAATAGEECTVHARYFDPLDPNSTDVRLCKFTAPTGITATLNSLGATVAPAGGSGDISVTLTYDGGGTVTFSEADHGFDWVRQSEYLAENCPGA